MTDLRKLKKGDSVIYKNVGYGFTTYEPGLFTRSFDRQGMEWDERTKSWKFDSGLGLVTYAISADDPAGKAGIAK